jgi:hypothetical protein
LFVSSANKPDANARAQGQPAGTQALEVIAKLQQAEGVTLELR